MNFHASLAETSARPHLLMCPPRHFAVTYSINPWMDPLSWADRGGNLHGEAQRQWDGLRDALTAAGALVETIDPTPDLPDLVFTANAAVVLDGKAVLSRFRHPERRNEEPVFAAAFAALAERGLINGVSRLPDGIVLEGAGDCIWDGRRRLLHCLRCLNARLNALLLPIANQPAQELRFVDADENVVDRLIHRRIVDQFSRGSVAAVQFCD